MTSCWRWVAVRGRGARAIHHLVAGWQPTTGRESPWDTACGETDASVVIVEPGGEERCAACWRRALEG